MSADDRYFRFGYAAKDANIDQYVAGLDFERDEIFGIYNYKLQLIAMAHLAYAPFDSNTTGAEFGVSVLPYTRGRGYGARLFERAAMHATNQGIDVMFIHALSENQAMLKIATNAGARIHRYGAESEAFLQLPTVSLGSRLAEFVEERMAQSDYRIKVKMKRLSRFIAGAEKMEELACAAHNDKEEAQLNYKEQMTKLHQQSKTAAAKLEELKEAGANTWETVATDMEKIHDALHQLTAIMRRSLSLDQRRCTCLPLTAMANALGWPTSTTSVLPLVMPV